jgi:Do/DeqQ family serine protease
MLQKNTWIAIILVSLSCGALGSWIQNKSSNLFSKETFNVRESTDFQPNETAKLTSAGSFQSLQGDFATASEASSQSVVFIKTISNMQARQSDFWDFWDFFGQRGPVSSAGSGVIISDDGYIVTNNHVINDADNIEVIMRNKHSYKAKIIGTDPNTDLAVIKVEAKGLKPVTFTDSDKIRIGEWVIAIGNPLNLTSTVTAGIVSAKGRNINIVNSQFPIESFIQTDAAINPGNSGGALVNVRGELVGINTAIASKTGAYSGYGFAIPANIVKKVVKDLIEYGDVQIPFIGAEIVDIDKTIADKLPDDDYTGVYVFEVNRGSSAQQSGLREGDIILKADGENVNSKAEYLERLSLHRPGETMRLLIKRGKEQSEIKVTVTNKEGTTALLKNVSIFSQPLGCNLAPLSKMERDKLGVEGGFRVSNIRSGRIAQMGLPDGFIIISVNKRVPDSIGELEKLLTQSRGKIYIDGIHPNGTRSYYSFYSY